MRKVLGPLFLLGTSLPALAAFDPPDLNLEYRLHRQFLKNTGASSSKHSPVSENYQIQNGETLRSLSEMLYGDGSYWPSKWAQGQGLNKPHLVRPGHHLQFLMGSEDETPAFRFSEDAEPVSGLERTAGTGGQNPIVDIPPPEVPPKPVLKVPGSFPEWQSVYKARKQVQIDYSQLGKTRAGISNRYFLRAWAQETPVNSIGRYQENDTEAGLPLPNQYVYVKIKKGHAQQGQKYLVVKDHGQLKRMNKQWDGKDKAFLIEVAAEIELGEPVSAVYKRSQDKDEFDSYRALVTRATGLSVQGCDIVPGSLKQINTDSTGTPGNVQAQIIGSESSQASALFGPGQLVFLNKGSSQGVEEGQMFEIFADRMTRNFRAEVPISPASSGTLKIVETSLNVSTAIVINSRDSVQQGDQVRQASAARSEVLDYVKPGGASGADDDIAPSDEQPAPLDDDSLEDEIDSGEKF